MIFQMHEEFEFPKILWYIIDERITRRRQLTIETWEEMKVILGEKYLPSHYFATFMTKLIL